MSGSIDFGSLVLLIGDFHTPSRRPDVPADFKELLNTDKIGMVICTGNVGTKAVQEQLKGIAGDDCKIVQGDTDYGNEFPETSVTQVGEFKVGVIHGHQIVPWGDQDSLSKCAGRLGVDILVSGHTHRNSIVEVGGKFLINPGSVTGACSPNGEFDLNPSFMLMDIQGNVVTLYTYQQVKGELEVSKNVLEKKS